MGAGGSCRAGPVNQAGLDGTEFTGWRGAKGAAEAYARRMKTILTILVVIAMLATLGVLFAGMLGLVKGGGDPMRSNRLMRWRIVLQGVALLLFALLLSLVHN
jgi:hypothetical protein